MRRPKNANRPAEATGSACKLPGVLRPGSFREKVKVADLKRRAACAFDQRRAAMSRCFDAIIIGLGHAHVPLGNRLTRTGRATERMFFRRQILRHRVCCHADARRQPLYGTSSGLIQDDFHCQSTS